MHFVNRNLLFGLLSIAFSVLSVQGDLIGKLETALNYSEVKSTAGENVYYKNSLNEAVPMVIKFTWSTPEVLNDSNPITWTRNSSTTLSITKETSADAYYTDETATTGRIFTVTIAKNLLDYVGNITLTLNLATGLTKSATVSITSPPFFSINDDKPRRHLQGDSIVIRCPVRGNPSPGVVKWAHISQNATNFTDVQFSSRINATTSTGSSTLNDYLVINSLEFLDDGYIRCHISNELGQDTHIVELRVKDRLAALWPFIGIVIEVLVLVTAILLYEKRRSRHFLANREETKEGANGGYGQVATTATEGGDTDAETRQRTVKA